MMSVSDMTETKPENKRKQRLVMVVITTVFIIGAAYGVHAQSSNNYSINSSVISPSGDQTNSSNYQILSTFGEPGAETYGSANYGLEVGFPPTTKRKPTIIEVIQKVPETIVKVIEETSTKVTKKLMEPVVGVIPTSTFIDRAFDRIDNLIRVLRQNAQVQKVVTDIVQPLITVGVLITSFALVTTTTTALELTNIFYLLFRFGYFWLIPLHFGKRHKPWGVVFDNATGKPIRNAIVRIFSKEFDKLKESLITDKEGRFGFLIDQGEYYVTVLKPGYLFPSTLITTATVTAYFNIYRGEIITIKERREGVLNINIPLDPEQATVTQGRIAWLRILNVIGVLLEKMNIPLLIGGVVLGGVALIINPTILNAVILLIYGLLVVAKAYFLARIQRSIGTVIDTVTKKPIELALVRVFNMERGSLITTRITNKLGRFFTIVNPGQYYVVVAKAGYEPYRSDPFEVKKERSVLKISVKLKPLNHASVPPATQPMPQPSATPPPAIPQQPNPL